MGRQAPAGLLGIHPNLPAAVPNDIGAALGGGPFPAGVSAQERAVVESLKVFSDGSGRAYVMMMNARPQTVGYDLTDSPAGLAGWILVHPGFAHWSYGKDPKQSPRRRTGRLYPIVPRRRGSGAPTAMCSTSTRPRRAGTSRPGSSRSCLLVSCVLLSDPSEARSSHRHLRRRARRPLSLATCGRRASHFTRGITSPGENHENR
jgi:hypothetical protein